MFAGCAQIMLKINIHQHSVDKAIFEMLNLDIFLPKHIL